MANRTVAVTLTANVNGYLTGMEQMRSSTGKVSDEARKKLEAQGQAFTTLGGLAIKAGVIVAAGIGLAIARFAEFDQAMSQVQAATQASAEDMGLLRDAALEAGASTVFTATEAANAIEELGKAGLTTAQIIDGGLSGALTLAAAGGIEVAQAAQFAATALKQFNLEGSDLPKVADLLAAGAGKAVGDVDDLAQALNQAGLIANGAGFSIEETTGVLAAFADAGLLGSDAGTSLKTAIVALQAPTGRASDLLKQYGLNVYDSNGQMLGFAAIAGQLQDKLGGLDEKTRNAALATIFGTDALRSANVLYTQGAEGIQKYIDQTDDSGYAAKVAADRLNNLAGDVEKLGGSFDTALIKTGSGANDVLRGLVQSATFLTDAVGEIPEPVLATGLAFGVAGAAILLTGGAALVTVPKFAALKASVTASGISMGTFALKTAAVGGALGVATLLVGLFIAQQAQASASAEELAGSLDKTTGALTDYSRELIAKKLEEAGAFKDVEENGVTQQELTDAIYRGGDAYDALVEKLSNTRNGLGLTTSSAGELLTQVREVNGIVESGKEKFENISEATAEAADSTKSASERYQEAADNVQTLTDNLNSLIDTINKANGVGQDAVSTNAAYQQSIADVAEYIAEAKKGTEGYTLGLDESTAAGAANADMLRGLAADSQSAAAAQLALTGNTDEYLASVAAGRQQIIDNATALGATAEQAQALADKIYAIPNSTEIQLIVDTAAATTAITDFLNASKGIKIGVGLYANKSLPFADGGAAIGPGTGTSDSIDARLSNGEHVLTAADVRAAGGQEAIYAWRASLHRGYATGGAVQYAPTATSSDMGARVNVNQTIYTNDAGVAADMSGQRVRAALAGL